MIRRRPIPRSAYHWHPEPKPSSLRFELILNGAVRVQPDRSEILIDDTHALMTMRTFEDLAEYSGTKPTGVYEGKMWRRHDGVFDYRFLASGGKPEWLLCWYGRCDKPDYVSNNSRKIILLDGDLPA